MSERTSAVPDECVFADHPPRGANCGLNSCRLASSGRVAAGALIARGAAGGEILAATLFALAPLSSHPAGTSALPFTGRVGASSPFQRSSHCTFSTYRPGSRTISGAVSY